MARMKFSAVGASIISLMLMGCAGAQENSQPTNEEAAEAIDRSNPFSQSKDGVYRPVVVEKCGAAEAGSAPFPVPPGALVCTVAITYGQSEGPRGRIVLFFHAAGKWNAQVVI